MRTLKAVLALVSLVNAAMAFEVMPVQSVRAGGGSCYVECGGGTSLKAMCWADGTYCGCNTNDLGCASWCVEGWGGEDYACE